MDAVAGGAVHVLVCDRQPLVCEGAIAILEREPDISIAGAATSFDDAIAIVRSQERPTVVVIGHDPPHFDAIDLTGMLNQPGLPVTFCVLLVEVDSMDGSLLRALRAGAHGVLGKERAPGLLASTVRSLSSGSIVIGPQAGEHLVAELSRVVREEPAALPEGRLSARERQVLELTARGLRNREIAESLSLSVATVKSHLHNLSRKLGLRDRVQVVILAYELGIVRPSGTADLPRPAAGEMPARG